jgi:hypothetical protein
MICAEPEQTAMSRLVCILIGFLVPATLALGPAMAGEENQSSTGTRIKSDAKSFGRSVKDATVDVGRQIGSGTKKTAKSIGNKVSSDARSGKPGDGSARRQNEKKKTATAGRD